VSFAEIPASSEQCIYSYGGKACTTVNKGHHSRHMLSHLPPRLDTSIFVQHARRCSDGPKCLPVIRKVVRFTVRIMKVSQSIPKGLSKQSAYQVSLFLFAWSWNDDWPADYQQRLNSRWSKIGREMIDLTGVSCSGGREMSGMKNWPKSISIDRSRRSLLLK